jgi:quercetin dioxygenase-like cupin family protein
VLKQTLAIAAVAAPLVIASAMAQQPAIKRTPLQTVDFPAGYNVVTAIAEVPAGSCAGRHTHPGVESSYVMEGPMVVKIEGKPDQTFKTGDSFQIPVNAVHDACGVGGHLYRRKRQAARFTRTVNRPAASLSSPSPVFSVVGIGEATRWFYLTFTYFLNLCGPTSAA